MLYQLQMATLLSLLGTRTNLIDRKCCIFNGEKEYVFGLWSKTYFSMIYDQFKILVHLHTYMCVFGPKLIQWSDGSILVSTRT
jgi:hypothetical protein